MPYLSCGADAVTTMCDWMFEDIKEEEKRSAKARANDLKKLQAKEKEPMARAML